MSIRMTLITMILLPLSTWAADLCEKKCMINADCSTGGSCVEGLCQNKTAYCANERWSVNNRGEMTDCGAYTCDSLSGLCRRQASESEHCSSGYAYDGDKSCTSSVQCDPTNDPECKLLMDKWRKTRDQWEALFAAPAFKPFSCIACTAHTDCRADQMCWQGTCVNDAKYCDMDAQKKSGSYIKAGLNQACNDYSCEKVSGLCLSDCIQNSDCATGLTCDVITRHCK